MAAEHVRALGERIRLRREELGMTQDEVARQMKGSIDGQRISKWERGENRPRDESLEDLARVLKTTATALIVPVETNGETPDLSGPANTDDRLARIEQALVEMREERARNVRDIQALLERQDGILQNIEDAISRDRQARAELDESAERLQAAVADASRFLRAETPSPAAAPAPPTT